MREHDLRVVFGARFDARDTTLRSEIVLCEQHRIFDCAITATGPVHSTNRAHLLFIGWLETFDAPGRSEAEASVEGDPQMSVVKSMFASFARLFSPRRRADDFKALLMADLGLKY